jgi:hypothetical protein
MKLICEVDSIVPLRCLQKFLRRLQEFLRRLKIVFPCPNGEVGRVLNIIYAFRYVYIIYFVEKKTLNHKFENAENENLNYVLLGELPKYVIARVLIYIIANDSHSSNSKLYIIRGQTILKRIVSHVTPCSNPLMTKQNIFYQQ